MGKSLKDVTDLTSAAFVSSSENLNGALRVQGTGDIYQSLRERYLDHLDTFKDWSKINEFVSEAEDSGISFYFDNAGNVWWNNYQRFCNTEFYCSAPWLEKNKLYPFQHIGMNFAYHVITQDFNPRVLLRWSTGSGKSWAGTLIAQKLVDEGRADLVLCFCKKIKQLDWLNNFKETNLRSEIVDGNRSYRHKRYQETESQVLVMNYEKARFPSKKGRGKKAVFDWSRTDLKELLELMDGKRVFIICDEAQKINNAASQLSQGFDSLFNSKSSLGHPEWVGGLALTATLYTTSPLNIRDLYSIMVPSLPRVSSPKRDFQEEYMDESYGFDIFGEVNRWDPKKLYLLGKRHERYSHSVSKKDPEIARQFPPLQEEIIEIDLSEEDRKIYNQVLYEARKESGSFVNVRNSVSLLRSICNTSEALLSSESEIAKVLRNKKFHFETEKSEKYQYIEDLIKEILNEDQKVVAFSFWTSQTLFPYLKSLKKNLGSSVPIYHIYGVGMDSNTLQKNIKDFNESKSHALLLASDVGQDGINLYSENMIHIETPTTYAAYDQRTNRINRSDSKSFGIESNTVYRFITSNTIEVPVEAKMQRRKSESGLSSADKNTYQELHDLLFYNS